MPLFPAPLQLLCRGLFPCAPITPSLAVDLRILEFIRLLFVRQSPNQTVWCDAVETFLDGMGYKLSCKSFIRITCIVVLAMLFTGTSAEHLGSSHFCSHRRRSEGPGASPTSSISQMDTFVLVACFVLEEMFAMEQMLVPLSTLPNPTPTFFLSKDDVKVMEDFVQKLSEEKDVKAGL
ncbi:hypothetical protein DFJ58DRAFT_844196 [Suillus subalutaceus]|uniref:uncharacterized protein n=1 Tax=Suillus subalutaceus TaxID=48586 RepID=UPI001B8645D2|nr:uncharacterized protein DFJ58DRAFT_844196 [Suillus subalutaceus]KAG1843964.1 hypothetical protein DFJ58DRAFT_844196 [Suillus subalutaceus]